MRIEVKLHYEYKNIVVCPVVDFPILGIPVTIYMGLVM